MFMLHMQQDRFLSQTFLVEIDDDILVPHPFLCAYVPRLALGMRSWLEMAEANLTFGHSGGH